MDEKRKELLEETKMIVKSVIIPYRDGTYLRTLCRDYEEIEGRPLPYRDLGYSTLVGFLRSIPDTVTIINKGPSDILVYPVADAATAHIIKLVSEQNKGTKRGSNRGYHHSYSNRPSYSSLPLYHYNRNPHTYTYPNPYTASPYKYSLNANSFVPRSVPTSVPRSVTKYSNNDADELIKLYSNLRTSAVTAHVTRTDTAPVTDTFTKIFTYDETKSNDPIESSTVPPNVTGIAVIRSSASAIASNVSLSVCKNAVPSNFSQHNYTDDAVLKQLSTSVLIPNVSLNNNANSNAFPYSTHSNTSVLTSTIASVVSDESLSPSTNSVLHDIIAPMSNATTKWTGGRLLRTVVVSGDSGQSTHTVTTVTTTPIRMTAPTVTVTKTQTIPNVISDFIASRKVNNDNNKVNINSKTVELQKNERIAKPSNSSAASSHSSTIDDETIEISEVAIDNFRRILAKFPNGLPMCKFMDEYKKHTGVACEASDWGFQSPVELFYRLKHVFAISPPDTKNNHTFPGYGYDCFLHDARVKSFKTPKINHSNYSRIPEKVIIRILKLISGDTFGVIIDDFAMSYNANYNEQLQFKKYNFSDILQFFETLEYYLPISVITWARKTRVVIKDRNNVNEWLKKCAREGQHALVANFIDLPSDIVLPGEEYRDATLPHDARPFEEGGRCEFVAVIISSVISPSIFWVILRGQNYYTALDLLMDDLSFYDTANQKLWCVPPELVCVGFPVACKFPGDLTWHRAKIIRVHPKGQEVTVTFVDYGGFLVVSVTQLRLLKRAFFELPTQAFRVSLIGVKPSEESGQWSNHARSHILDFSLKDYWIACQFATRNEKNDGYHVCLCDTNDQSYDLYVHRYLVQTGHAQFDSESLKIMDAVRRQQQEGPDDYEIKWHHEFQRNYNNDKRNLTIHVSGNATKCNDSKN